MRGFLLDKDHVDASFHRVPSIEQHARTYPADWLLWVSSTTLGEVEAGLRMTHTTDQKRRDEYIKFLNEKVLDFVLDVTGHTRHYFGEIMGRIWDNNPPRPGTATEAHLRALGVDINDVWAVAVAWEHKLTFLTRDKMTCIRNAVADEVKFDCWI